MVPASPADAVLVCCSYKYPGPATVSLARCRQLLEFIEGEMDLEHSFLQSPGCSSEELKAGEFGSQALCVSWTGRKPEISDFSNLDGVGGAQWTAERRPPFLIFFESDRRVPGARCGSD